MTIEQQLAFIPEITVTVTNRGKRARVTAGDFELQLERGAGSAARTGGFWAFVPGTGVPTRECHFTLRRRVHEILNGVTPCPAPVSAV